MKPAANKLLRALDRGNSQDSVAVHSNRPSNVSNCKASRNSSKFNSERGSIEVQKQKSKSLKMKLKINVQPQILSGQTSLPKRKIKIAKKPNNDGVNITQVSAYVN